MPAAMALGATPAEDSAGDVILADGTVVWLDGGPVRYTEAIAGTGVVHRIAVEHGSLRPFTSNASAAALAADQLAAVTHPGAASRVIAPAGSGKTRVLTERARHLLRRWGLPPRRCVSSRSTRERRRRCRRARRLAGSAGAHAELVRPRGRQRGRTVRRATGDTARTTIRARRPSHARRLVEFPRKRNTDPIAPWIDALSQARLGLLDPRTSRRGTTAMSTASRTMLPRYRDALAERGPARLRRADRAGHRVPAHRSATRRARAAGMRRAARRRVPGPDARSPAARASARRPDLGVFGVGDDDQTIYGYQGRRPAVADRLRRSFPERVSHPLEVNYRCPADVVARRRRCCSTTPPTFRRSIRAATTATGLIAIDTTDDRSPR